KRDLRSLRVSRSERRANHLAKKSRLPGAKERDVLRSAIRRAGVRFQSVAGSIAHPKVEGNVPHGVSVRVFAAKASRRLKKSGSRRETPSSSRALRGVKGKVRNRIV